MAWGPSVGYRASTLVVLNSYIAIFSTTKYQNVPYNGGAKSIFSGSTATWLHCSWLFYSFLFLFFLYSIHTAIYCLCIHTAIVILFLYFFFSYILFFLFVCSYCYCSRYIILFWCLYYFIVLKAKINPLIFDVL